MALTQVLNDPAAIAATGAGLTEGDAWTKVTGEFLKTFLDNVGIAVEIGRGETDTDITFIALRSDDGTRCFIHPNTAKNGIIVTTTRP